MLICVNDVTAYVRDRHRAESLAQRLEVTEERYRTLFETLPHGVIHYNADGTILGAIARPLRYSAWRRKR